MPSKRPSTSSATSEGWNLPLTGLDPGIADWGRSFKRELKRNELASRALKTLVDEGCHAGEIAQLLYVEVNVAPHKRRGISMAEGEWKRRARLLERDLGLVADSLEWIEDYWGLSNKTSDFELIAADGETLRVPAKFVKHIPSLLRQYGLRLALLRSRRASPLNPGFRRCLALPILSAYLRGATGRPHYTEIGHLLQAAYSMTELTDDPGPEAVRKNVERFRKTSPKLYQEIDDLTIAYFKGRPDAEYWKFVYVSFLIARSKTQFARRSVYNWSAAKVNPKPRGGCGKSSGSPISPPTGRPVSSRSTGRSPNPS